MISIEELLAEPGAPIVVANRDGLISFINDEFTQAFGWTSADVVGQSLTAIIPDNLHDAHNLGFSRFLTTGKPTLLNQPLSLRIRKKSGEEIDAEHFITAEFRDGQWNFAARIVPETA